MLDRGRSGEMVNCWLALLQAVLGSPTAGCHWLKGTYISCAPSTQYTRLRLQRGAGRRPSCSSTTGQHRTAFFT